MLRLAADPPDDEPDPALDALGEQLDRLSTAGRDPLLADGPAILAAARAHLAGRAATGVVLDAVPARPAHDELAAATGLHLQRELLQLRRVLPVGEPWDLEVRTFRPGLDDDAWLAVNNHAFAWHPEQGGWDRADLQARMAEPWFDPAGFLVHDGTDGIDGFCWTKVHSVGADGPGEPALGEIFAIAVDPDHHGRGLGRALVLAGLDHLAQAGLAVGMLWVEADNAPALALYDRLGFARHASHRWYRGSTEPLLP